MHTYVFVASSMKGNNLLTKLGPVSVSVEGQIELNPDKIEVSSGNTPVMQVTAQNEFAK